MAEQRISITWREGLEVSAAVVLADGPADGNSPARGGAASGKALPGVVLAHGAGGNFQTPFLVELSAQLAARGIGSLRFNFPYSENRKHMPDKAPVLEDCYRAVAQRAADLFPQGFFLGGKSMGGRIASHIVAQGTGLPANLKGLIFLGYPLHPPGKQLKMRDEHLYAIRKPMLFVEGTRDAFAERPLLQNVLDRLATARVHWIEGGDHSFKVSGRKAASVSEEILEAILTFAATEASA